MGKDKKKSKSNNKDQAFIIAIDQGTTGSRVFCFAQDGSVLATAYKEFTQHFPKPGWVEHDANEIWQGVKDLLKKAIKQGGLDASNCQGIGITNQRETAVIWDRSTGEPIHNAIVWQCRRTAQVCNQLNNAGHADLVRSKTGLVIDAYFSGTKYAWILDNVEGARQKAEQGELAAGTIDSWLLYKLSGGQEHASDYSNASRTLLYNIKDKQWDPELLEIFKVPQSILPEVKPSRCRFGTTKGIDVLPDGVPILAMIGDQQAALFGQLCVNPGDAKNTYGTGCFLLFNTGDEFVLSKSGLITTLACNAEGNVCYALEGAVFIGGAVVQWLRDYMEFFKAAPKSEKLARELNNEADEVVFVPAFAGLGAPHWDQEARGAIFGLTRDTNRARITRAALNSIALQSYDLARAMEQDTGKKMHELRVDGGATENAYLMQYQADILNTPVVKPDNVDTTALGSAYLAGMEAGFWPTIDDLRALKTNSQVIQPSMTDKRREHELKYWQRAVDRVKGWVDKEE